MEQELLGTFDRVLSLEMLEHMKNYGALFEKISSWLKPVGNDLLHHRRKQHHKVACVLLRVKAVIRQQRECTKL